MVKFHNVFKCKPGREISWEVYHSIIRLINVTQIYVSTICFILKQGYMFRLEVSHLQAPTTFSLPDALPTLGSHSVYICGIHFS